MTKFSAPSTLKTADSSLYDTPLPSDRKVSVYRTLFSHVQHHCNWRRSVVYLIPLTIAYHPISSVFWMTCQSLSCLLFNQCIQMASGSSWKKIYVIKKGPASVYRFSGCKQNKYRLIESRLFFTTDLVKTNFSCYGWTNNTGHNCWQWRVKQMRTNRW